MPSTEGVPTYSHTSKEREPDSNQCVGHQQRFFFIFADLTLKKQHFTVNFVLVTDEISETKKGNAAHPLGLPAHACFSEVQFVYLGSSLSGTFSEPFLRLGIPSTRNDPSHHKQGPACSHVRFRATEGGERRLHAPSRYKLKDAKCTSVNSWMTGSEHL